MKTFTLGRENAGKAQILLSGDTISSLHAKVGIDERGRLWVLDLDSKNGTKVINQEGELKIKNQPVFIEQDDSLIFGKEKFSVKELLSYWPNSSNQEKKYIEEKKTNQNDFVYRCIQCGFVNTKKPCIKCGNY